MYLNHSIAGALAIKPIIDKQAGKFTQKENTVLWFVGITAAVLPDFDIAYSVLLGLKDHRSFITHGMFLYVVISVLLFLLSYFQKKEVFGRNFFRVLSLVFFVGVSTHFIIDLFMGGLVLLAPFSYKMYGCEMVLNGGSGNRLVSYISSFYMLIELLLTTVFFAVFREKKYFTPKLFALSYFVIALASFVFVSFSFF